MSGVDTTPNADEPNEEMVRVGDSSKPWKLRAYHTRKCKHYPEGGDDVPLTVAEDWGLTLCDSCDGKVYGVADERQGDRDYNQIVETLREEMGVEKQA